MLPSLTISSTASIYHSTVSVFSQQDNTPASASASVPVKQVSIFTKIKNKISDAMSFCFLKPTYKICDRLLTIRDNVIKYQGAISDKIDKLISAIKKLKISVVNNINRINVISISFNHNRNHIYNYNINKL